MHAMPRRSIGERLARSFVSHDLRHRQDPCDVDVLHAVALVSATHPSFSALARIQYAQDASAWRDAVLHVCRAARHLDLRKRWKSTRQERTQLAVAVLAYWLAPHCRTCTGLRFRRMQHAPALDAKVCEACGGTGDAGIRLPKSMDNAVWLPRANDLLAWVQRRDSDGCLAVLRRLRRG